MKTLVPNLGNKSLWNIIKKKLLISLLIKKRDWNFMLRINYFFVIDINLTTVFFFVILYVKAIRYLLSKLTRFSYLEM